MKKVIVSMVIACSALVMLLLAGALFSACSNDDAAIDNPTDQPAEGRTVIFTATLAPKGDDGGQTRAITTGNDGDGKEILNVAWAVGEYIAVYYQKNDDSYATAKARVTSVDSESGVATIATVNNYHLVDPKDGSTVKFVYPYSLAKNGEININSLRQQQNGLLTGDNSISSKFDVATYVGTLNVSAGTAVTDDRVIMTNECCICKFNFTLNPESPSVTHYTVSIEFAGGYTYMLSGIPSARMSSLYVAMLPVASSLTPTTATITAIGYHSDDEGQTGSQVNEYYGTSSGVWLEAKKFYRNVSVTLRSHLLDLTAGSITARDGDIIFQSSNSPTSNTITIPGGVTVTLSGVNISSHESAGIICKGSANIILDGTNRVSNTGALNPAIQAGPLGSTLTISGSGVLTATGGEDAAGIGSRDNGSCGNITISGGSITVTGGNGAAGIGSGSGGQCGDIKIIGGRGSATKGSGAPYCIGLGTAPSFCGIILIGTKEYYNGNNFKYDGETILAKSKFTWSFLTQ